MSIRLKFFGILALILLASLGLQWYLIIASENIIHDIEHFDEDLVEKVFQFSAFKDSMHMMMFNAYGYVLSGDTELKIRASSMKQTAEQALQKTIGLAPHDKEEISLVANVREVYEEVKEKTDTLIREYERGVRGASLEKFVSDSERAQRAAMMSVHDNWDVFIEKERTERISALAARASYSHRFSLALMVGLFILVFGIAVLTAIRITGALSDSINASKRYASGDFKIRLSGKSKDEVGVLQRTLNAMADQLSQSKEHLERQVHERTSKLQEAQKELMENIKSLKDTKSATINILEDLDIEKKNVENKVIVRTRELATEKEKLSQVTEHLNLGAILFNLKGSPVFINKTAGDIISHSGALSGVVKKLSSVFPSLNLSEVMQMCKSGKLYRLRNEELKGRFYDIIAQGVVDDKNNLTSCLLSLEDNTSAILLNRAKDDFLSLASHQLRTPATIISGNTELLLEKKMGSLNKKQEKIISDTHSGAVRLLKLIQDLLNIIRLEQEHLTYTFAPVSLRPFMELQVQEMEPLAKSENVTVSISKESPDITIRADEKFFRQAVQNIMSNAIKYHAVKASAKRKVDIFWQKKNGKAEIVFSDNGIGMPKKEKGKIFQRFYRASNVQQLSASATGLGLAITKQIVEGHEGEVWFESEENKGTTFHIALPLSENKKTNKKNK